MPLHALSVELKTHIASFCPADARRNLARTSMEWREIVRPVSQKYLAADLLGAFSNELDASTLDTLVRRTRSFELTARKPVGLVSTRAHPRRYLDETRYASIFLGIALRELRNLRHFTFSTGPTTVKLDDECIWVRAGHRVVDALTNGLCSFSLVELTLDMACMDWTGADRHQSLPCDVSLLTELPVLKKLFLRLRVICDEILLPAYESDDDIEDPPIALESLVVNLCCLPVHSVGPNDIIASLPYHCRQVHVNNDLTYNVVDDMMEAMERVRQCAPSLRVARTVVCAGYAGRYFLQAYDACTELRYMVEEGDWEGGVLLHGPNDQWDDYSLGGEFVMDWEEEGWVDERPRCEEVELLLADQAVEVEQEE